MDPQQRLVLECVYMAMEDGGITRIHLNRSDTGVYIGDLNQYFVTRIILLVKVLVRNPNVSFMICSFTTFCPLLNLNFKVQIKYKDDS